MGGSAAGGGAVEAKRRAGSPAAGAVGPARAAGGGSKAASGRLVQPPLTQAAGSHGQAAPNAQQQSLASQGAEMVACACGLGGLAASAQALVTTRIKARHRWAQRRSMAISYARGRNEVKSRARKMS